MKTLQIHGISEDGTSYRLNELRGDNAAATDETRGVLERRCWQMFMGWQALFPHDQIKIVEVERWSSF